MSEFKSQSFSLENLSSALQIAEIGAKAVEQTLSNRFGEPEYETKDGDERSWVTRWDTWAQGMIIKELSKFSSDIGFRCEEEGVDTSNEVYWTVDSIDATSGFVRGNDVCTTMISLVDHDQPVVAVINDFVRGSMYTAASGDGAWKQDSKNRIENIAVSKRPLAIAQMEIYCDENTEAGQQLQKSIEATGAYLLRNVAAGHTLTSVARGSTEGFISLRNPYATDWDIAPGVLLIHEAGGIVKNIGQPGYRLSNRDFIASNRVVYPELKRIANS